MDEFLESIKYRPKGPNGGKRPVDAVGPAIKVDTGEIQEDIEPDNGKHKAAQALGWKGGAARAM